MLKNSINCELLQCRIYRLLFLFFLAVVSISPIADAYTDSLSSATDFYNDLYDSDSPVSINDLKLNDALNSLNALKRSSAQCRDNSALLPDDLATDRPVGRTIKHDLPANDTCSSPHYSFASSDPSPPVI
jgi:hypothetical protein